MKSKGFTLIELLMVISIIAILSSIVLASLTLGRARAQIAAGQQFDFSVMNAVGDELIGEWDMTNCSGSTVTDSSGNGNTGSFSGSAWSTNSPFEPGCSASFNGTGTYITMPNSTALQNVQNSDYTLSAWFYPNSIPPGTGTDNNADYGIVIKPGNHLGLSFGNTGKFAMTHWLTSTTDSNAVSQSSYAAGNWYNVVGVVSKTKGTVQIYVNGTLQGSSTFPAGSATLNYSTIWKVGIASPGASTYQWSADGLIDNVRIYGESLTADAIKQKYLAEAGSYEHLSIK